MSDTGSESREGLTATHGEESNDDRRVLSYEGSKVPLFMILIWIAFFVWGVIYMVRWVPESWQEWVQGGATEQEEPKQQGGTE